jgi:hypothetical protein
VGFFNRLPTTADIELPIHVVQVFFMVLGEMNSLAAISLLISRRASNSRISSSLWGFGLGVIAILLDLIF